MRARVIRVGVLSALLTLGAAVTTFADRSASWNFSAAFSGCEATVTANWDGLSVRVINVSLSDESTGVSTGDSAATKSSAGTQVFVFDLPPSRDGSHFFHFTVEFIVLRGPNAGTYGGGASDLTAACRISN